MESVGLRAGMKNLVQALKNPSPHSMRCGKTVWYVVQYPNLGSAERTLCTNVVPLLQCPSMNTGASVLISGSFSHCRSLIL